MCMWIDFLFSLQACGVKDSRNCFAKGRVLSFFAENSDFRQPEILIDKWQFGIYILRQLHRLANLTSQGVLKIQNGAHRRFVLLIVFSVSRSTFFEVFHLHLKDYPEWTPTRTFSISIYLVFLRPKEIRQ